MATRASDQKGQFTPAQAARLGVDRVTLRRDTRNSVVRSIRHGVYIFKATPFSPDEELRTAWLSLDPSRTVAKRLQAPEQIVICTTSAGQQHGIGDFGTPQHEFYSANRKHTRAKDIRLRIRTLEKKTLKLAIGYH
nr:type IV toxin-antitoxin system AbiEi family antitoxin domain-containing protein [Corynebacterium glutamicum]